MALALIMAGCRDSSGPDGVFGCDSVSRYEIGETVAGTIRTTDCSPGGDGNVDFYQFRQAAHGPASFRIEVPMSSAPMFFGLFDSRQDLVDEVEVGPGEEASIPRFLDEGTYVIAIGAEQVGPGSTYTLSSLPAIQLAGPPFLGCTESQAYTIGATVTGLLFTDDCPTPDGKFMELYEFTVAAQRAVTIDLTSDEFDALLYIFNAEGAIVARNDDNGISLDSRIRTTLPAGTYSIGVTSFDNSEGEFTLRAQ